MCVNMPAAQDGAPQVGYVGPQVLKGYSYTILDANADIEVSVTPYSGNNYLYISTTKLTQATLSTAMWKSTNYFSGDSITISHKEPNFCAGPSCVYYVYVFGQTSSFFSVQASSTSTSLTLQDGIPQLDNVPTNLYDYFVYVAPRTVIAGSYLSFAVTPLTTGDPDLYVSTMWQRPTATTNNTIFSRLTGGDFVQVTPVAGTTYYIGVHSFVNSTFTVLAQMHPPDDTAAVTLMVNGVPQFDQCRAGRSRYFQLQLFAPHDFVSLTLNTRFGSPAVYVSANTFPTALAYDYTAPAGASQYLKVPTSKCATFPCNFFMMVVAANQAQFTVQATTADAISFLEPGMPRQGSVDKGKYQYYQVYVDQVTTTMDLTITVSAFSGDPDLYISDSVMLPDINTYKWKSSTGFGGEAYTLPASQTRVGKYYIAVYGFTDATYSIVTTFDSPVALQDGVAQRGAVKQNVLDYFSFETSQSGNVALQFTASSSDGNVYLYVSNNPAVQPVPSDPATYQWSSALFMTSQLITITTGDANVCRTNVLANPPVYSCKYAVGVYGVAPTSTFVVTAATALVIAPLQVGVPFNDAIPANSYSYFSFTVPSVPAVMYVTVTALSGDPDVYMSTTQTMPNRTNGFMWSSAYAGADAITLDSADGDARFIAGTYYIAVYAFDNAAFTISVAMDNAQGIFPTFLMNGQPQSGLVAASKYRYYQILVGMGTALTLNLAPKNGNPV